MSEVADLAWLLHNGRVVVLSGAGLSTESGIPDYRGPDGVRRRRAPMTFADFTGSAAGRQRYWARSFLGWPVMAAARPNAGHRAVAAWAAAGRLSGVITQNVDGLHQAAGTPDVLDLHGRLDRVVCLDCGELSSRAELQRRQATANPGFAEAAGRVEEVNPDGDVELDDAAVAGFQVPACVRCGGVLKPDVVFFGESVPKPRVERATALVEAAAALVVLGSSLSVMSGYRFVRLANRVGVPVAVVNEGRTRADGEVAVRVDAQLGPTLTALNATLGL